MRYVYTYTFEKHPTKVIAKKGHLLFYCYDASDIERRLKEKGLSCNDVMIVKRK